MRTLLKLPGFVVGRPACFVSRVFLIGSLAAMGVAVLALSTGGERLSVLAADSPGGSLESFGLTYEGVGGLALASMQGVAVLGAWCCATWGRDRMRKLGLTTLVAWAGLWLANAIYLAAATDNAWRDLAAWVMAGVFAAMGVRFLRSWPRKAPREENPGPRWTHREAEPVTAAA